MKKNILLIIPSNSHNIIQIKRNLYLKMVEVDFLFNDILI